MTVSIQDGKVLLKDGKVLVDGCCCGISLVCDSIATSRSFCSHADQFSPALIDGVYYSSDGYDSCPSESPIGSYGIAAGNENDHYTTYDITYEFTTYCGDPVNCREVFHTSCGCQEAANCDDPRCTGDSYYDITSGIGGPDEQTIHYSCGESPVLCGQGHYTAVATRTGNQDLSYILELARDSLPPYDYDFDDSCEAVYSVSPDESSISIQRFIPKFVVNATAEVDRTITYKKHFVPELGSPSDTDGSVILPAGATEITDDEVIEPDTNGIITITNVQLA